MLWSTCVLAERRGAAADGFWKTERRVCVPFCGCFITARALDCVCVSIQRSAATRRRRVVLGVCCVCEEVCKRRCVCVNAAETMARRVDARGQGIAGH